MKCKTFSGFSFEGSEKCIFFFLISVCKGRSMPCWKNICTTALVCGWLLYREWYFTYEVIPLQLSPQPSPFCTHSLTPIQPHTHTHTHTITHRQSYLNTVLHKHVQISSNGCSSKTQTWTQTHSSKKQVILEMTWYAKLHICSQILPSCHVIRSNAGLLDSNEWHPYPSICWIMHFTYVLI